MRARFELLLYAIVDYAIFMLHRGPRSNVGVPGAERLKGYSADEISESPSRRSIRLKRTRQRSAGRHLRLYAKLAFSIRRHGEYTRTAAVLGACCRHHRDESGELVGFAKLTRDITERHQAESWRLSAVIARRSASILLSAAQAEKMALRWAWPARH